MPGSILGNEVQRLEDPELMTGAGTYTGDVNPEGLLFASFSRSPFAHADITRIDVDDAKAMPGVVAVYTEADLDVAPFEGAFAINPVLARPLLAKGRVRFVGEAVVMVIAQTQAQADDAAEQVLVDFEPLDVVADMESAVAEGAPLLFDDIKGNIVMGTNDPTDSLAGADVVVRARVVNQRIAAVPMEGNAVVAIPPTGDEPFTIYLSSQGAHIMHGMVCKVLGMKPEDVRVITPYVGGAFGAKISVPQECVGAIAAARALGKPVKWAETRSENLTSMPHGRAQLQWVEMGFAKTGAITGLRCHILGDSGGYGGFGGTLALGPTQRMAQGVYKIPEISYSAAMVLTNTTPVGAFRGAGRPEASAFLERLMDLGADELKMDPAELRRMNFIPPEDFPLVTLTGGDYDSGDYAKTLDAVLEAADYTALRAEQKERRESNNPVQLGIGLASYVEITAGGGGSEWSSVTVDEDGSASIRVGTSSHGQGHATSFAMLVNDKLGIPLDKIKFIQSDTREVPTGGGTMGSRSLQIGGNSVLAAAGGLLEKAKEIAAKRLEAAVADIVVTEDGRLGVAGVPTPTLGWDELAAASHEDADEPLVFANDWVAKGATYPFGTHLSVVEVDTETGRVTPRAHFGVDDCGTIINPLLVRGQQHGGFAQGIAQALFEEMVYSEDGQPMSMALGDYGMPCAVDLPPFFATNTETAAPDNPMGAKGIGESGTIGSTPSVQNAVIDALSHLGVRHINMPCSPERVWNAITGAKSGSLPPMWTDVPAAFGALPEKKATSGGPASEIDA